MIRVVHPGSVLTFYPSRIQGSKSHRIRIRNTGYFLKYSCLLLCELVDRTVMFQGLVQGNLTKSQALEVDSVVRRYLDLQVRKNRTTGTVLSPQDNFRLSCLILL
jgi:hypothetical protein